MDGEALAVQLAGHLECLQGLLPALAQAPARVDGADALRARLAPPTSREDPALGEAATRPLADSLLAGGDPHETEAVPPQHLRELRLERQHGGRALFFRDLADPAAHVLAA